MVKYLLLPSSVISQRDGRNHYISAARLIKLYGVRLEECTDDPCGRDASKLIPLRPDPTGEYRRPEVKR